MEFTFHNSYVILGRYSSKATLLLCLSHRCKNSTIVITIWLTVTKYTYFFYFFVITPKTFSGLIYELHEHLCSPPVFSGVRVAHLFSIMCVVFCFVCLRPCLLNVSGLSIFDYLFVFPYPIFKRRYRIFPYSHIVH